MIPNVFICIQSLANAGAERFVTDLACNINQERFMPIVVVTNSLNTELPFYNQLISKGITVEYAGQGNSFKRIRNLIKLIKKYKPQIVHSNTNAVLYMLLAIKISRKKVVHLFTVHSMAYRIFSGLKNKIIKRAFKKKKIIPVAICKTVQESLVESYGLNYNDIECVYNGVDTSIFVRSEVSADQSASKEVVVINVGTLYWVKNQKLLIESFSQLYESNKNVKLIIVGEGLLKDELEHLAESLKISKAVEFVGNQKNVEEFLNKADIYCSTSIVEGLPISVLEAESCSLPIVTTRAGGVVDIVFDNTNGFIVETKQDAICFALKKLVEDAELRAIMGKNSRKIAESHDIKKCVEGYEEIYSKYLGETNG